MPNPTYVTDCPSCGAQLEPHAGHPDSAPWVCHNCYRGFWVAELQPFALRIYDARAHSWQHPFDQQLRQRVEEERAAAQVRGTSALPEHLGYLGKRQRKELLRFPLSRQFEKTVRGAL